MQIMEAWTYININLMYFSPLSSVTPVHGPVMTDSSTGSIETHIGEFQFHLHLNINQGLACT
jgi:hypothetical protein